ncbi:MAG: insulinase family protein [Leptospira sp.]|nr:insulinase family protein [Leptospira sp.]
MRKRKSLNRSSGGFRKTRELIHGPLIAGNPEQIKSLQKIKKEDLEEFWKNQIQSKRKAILTRGDFSEPKVKSAIDRMFKLNGKSHDKFPEEKLDFDSLNAGYQSGKFKNIIVDKKVNQSAVIMAGILPQHNHPDFYAIQLLNYIIGGGGFNSYFMQQIRSDRGLAYSAVSYPSFKSDHGTIFFYSMTKNETAGEVYSLMNQILTEESFAKIKEQELENAKNAINNQFVFLFSGDDQILTNTLRFEEDSMPREYLHNYRSEIKKVSLTDLRRVGKKYFAGAGLKTVIVGPASSLRLKLKGETKTIGPEDLILE